MLFRSLILCLFAAGFFMVTVPGQVKKPEAAVTQVPFSESLQAIVVMTEDWSAVHGTARLFERKTKGSDWKAIGNPFPVVVGRSGLGLDPIGAGIGRGALPPFKKEGDGRSPSGRFPLTFAFGVGPRPSDTSLPYTELEEFTECVDDVNSNFYNRIVNRMQVGNFDWTSSEKMLAVGPEYERGVFVAYNSYPPVKGNGSCIFLHVWKDANTGTSGCTAMERSYLEKIIGWLDPKKDPYLIQFTEDQYRVYQDSWKLPRLK